ncbi:MAG: tetratricopeptide repeat protein, partial [Candidatus Helarchaeota archaeon]
MEFENKAKDAENRGDFPSAIQYYLQALESVKEMPLLDGLEYETARIQHQIGTLYTELGNFTEAIKYLGEASKSYLESDETLTKSYRLAGECQTTIGASYLAEGNYSAALESFQRAITFMEKATELEEEILRRYVVERTIFNYALLTLCLKKKKKK